MPDVPDAYLATTESAIESFKSRKLNHFSPGALISKFSKTGIQIFHTSFEIKYHPSIFEEYRIFNIDEQI